MSFRQLHVGRDEPILGPDLPIIDSHHHLFLRPAIRYLFDDFLKDVTSGHRVVASVYVEAHGMVRPDGPVMMRPLGEIEFANGAGAMAASGLFGDCRVCAAIVGHADLRFGAAIGEYLDRALERAPERLRGVRQVTIEDPSEAAYRFVPVRPPTGVMQHPNFRSGFSQLAPRGLSFDAAVFHPQLGEVAALAGAFPETTIVVNHAGHALALGLDADGRARVFEEWRKRLLEVARYPNVVCKVGGLGLPFWGFGFEERSDPIGYLELADAWRPYVETTIEAFGPERCMMESDYPPDSRSCGYVPLWNALKHIVRAASSDEKAALFHRTAARVYRIELPAL
jgi:predicted TIM-barrel fold metal-dependent hydrolase